LKDEESISRRIGPTYWHRLQKLANEDRAKRKDRLKLKKNVLKGQVTIFEMECIE
jgi:hypothetical protein